MKNLQVSVVLRFFFILKSGVIFFNDNDNRGYFPSKKYYIYKNRFQLLFLHKKKVFDAHSNILINLFYNNRRKINYDNRMAF